MCLDGENRLWDSGRKSNVLFYRIKYSLLVLCFGKVLILVLIVSWIRRRVYSSTIPSPWLQLVYIDSVKDGTQLSLTTFLEKFNIVYASFHASVKMSFILFIPFPAIAKFYYPWVREV